MRAARIRASRPGDSLQADIAQAVAALIVGLGMLTMVRVLLAVEALEAWPAAPPAVVWRMIWVGSRLDLAALCYMAMPAVPMLALRQKHRTRLLRAFVAVFGAAVLLDAAIEVEFFRYFGQRPNHLVLEHALDREVLLALGPWVTLKLLLTLGCGACILALAIALARRLLVRVVLLPGSRRVGHALALVIVACGIGLGARGTLDHRPINPSLASISSSRVMNELAGSGLFAVGYLAAHAKSRAADRLDQHHALLPEAESAERVRALLRGKRPLSLRAAPAVRVMEQASPERRWNVVVVVMESFTGRLVGALGGQPALSPELDALAAQGVLLTQCYATGERTVQGLEAIVSSFPPLPGESVVRRPDAHGGFETLASVLERRGYDSLFLYGGQGIFDHMRGFFLNNGFKHFIEEHDFRNPSFRGSWGVSDEDLFHRANEEFQARWEQGKPFLGVVLTVSLHTPWEFPESRAPSLPPDIDVPDGFVRDELSNFLYADFAVGEFMRQARSLAYAKDTLFVFVGDHGVHLRGEALLPSEEYRVPALFVPPDLGAAATIDDVTSQLDIAPTIMGYLGGSYRSTFYGRDVRSAAGREGMAIMVYRKRDYGVRRGDRLTVIPADGLSAHAYRVTPSGGTDRAGFTAHHADDARDALALLQAADSQLYTRSFTTSEPRAAEARDHRTHRSRVAATP